MILAAFGRLRTCVGRALGLQCVSLLPHSQPQWMDMTAAALYGRVCAAPAPPAAATFASDGPHRLGAPCMCLPPWAR